MVIFGGSDRVVSDDFIRDREQLSSRPWDLAGRRALAAAMLEQLRAQLAWIDGQLADGRAFLFGDAPGLADVDVFYNIAWLRRVFTTGLPVLDRMPHLVAWEARVRGIGHGTRRTLDPEAALDIARDAESAEPERRDPDEPNGLAPGDTVEVGADDYGRDPVRGVLVSSSAQHIALRRADPRVGTVVVHFPRAGFVVRQT